MKNVYLSSKYKVASNFIDFKSFFVRIESLAWLKQKTYTDTGKMFLRH